MNPICYLYARKVNRHKSLWNRMYIICHVSLVIHQLTVHEITCIVMVYLLNNCVCSVQYTYIDSCCVTDNHILLFVYVNFFHQSIMHWAVSNWIFVSKAFVDRCTMTELLSSKLKYNNKIYFKCIIESNNFGMIAAGWLGNKIGLHC